MRKEPEAAGVMRGSDPFSFKRIIISGVWVVATDRQVVSASFGIFECEMVLAVESLSFDAVCFASPRVA